VLAHKPYNNKPLTFGLANRVGAERLFFRRAIAPGGNGGPTGLLLRRCVRLAFILDSIAASACSAGRSAKGSLLLQIACYSGVTDSHELLGYFDFAALLLVSCILRRSNSAADFAVRELAVPVCNLLCYSQHQRAFAAAADAAAEPTSCLHWYT